MNRKVTFGHKSSHPRQYSPDSPQRGYSLLLEEDVDPPSISFSPEMLLAI